MSDEKKLKTATERTICLDPVTGVERVVAEGDKIPANWTEVGSGELAGRAENTARVGDDAQAAPAGKPSASETKKVAALEKSNAELQAKLDEALKAAEAAASDNTGKPSASETKKVAALEKSNAELQAKLDEALKAAEAAASDNTGNTDDAKAGAKS